jgi:hypothetical protein
MNFGITWNCFLEQDLPVFEIALSAHRYNKSTH